MKFVELCAGSAAITRRICGQPKILGFMGAKDRYADQIVEILGLQGITDIVLNDPGFWGVIWESYCQSLFPEVASQIDLWSGCDPKCLFEYCRKNRNSGDLVFRSASRLCLLASTYGGGEIGGFKGKHKLRPFVDGFIPSRASLSERVRNFRLGKAVTSTAICLTDVTPIPECFVYIDPPYAGLSGYENKAGREQVVSTAIRWKSLGCSVAISESTPLAQELGDDWTSVRLQNVSGQCRRNAKCSDEFLTYNLTARPFVV